MHLTPAGCVVSAAFSASGAAFTTSVALWSSELRTSTAVSGASSVPTCISTRSMAGGWLTLLATCPQYAHMPSCFLIVWVVPAIFFVSPDTTLQLARRVCVSERWLWPMNNPSLAAGDTAHTCRPVRSSRTRCFALSIATVGCCSVGGSKGTLYARCGSRSACRLLCRALCGVGRTSWVSFLATAVMFLRHSWYFLLPWWCLPARTPSVQNAVTLSASAPHSSSLRLGGQIPHGQVPAWGRSGAYMHTAGGRVSHERAIFDCVQPNTSDDPGSRMGGCVSRVWAIARHPVRVVGATCRTPPIVTLLPTAVLWSLSYSCARKRSLALFSLSWSLSFSALCPSCPFCMPARVYVRHLPGWKLSVMAVGSAR